MAVPREYLIVLNIQAALQAMRTRDGYHFNVEQIAIKLDANDDVESRIGDYAVRPFTVLQVNPDGWKVGGSRPNRADIVMPMTIFWMNETEDQTDTGRMLMFYQGFADVERALARDITRGSLAQDTLITSRTMRDREAGAQVWAQVDFEVRTCRTYGEPDQVGS